MIRFILAFLLCLLVTFPANADITVYRRIATTTSPVSTGYIFYDSEGLPSTVRCVHFNLYTGNFSIYSSKLTSTECLAAHVSADAFKPVFGDSLDFEQSNPTQANAWCNALIELLIKSESLITFYPTAWLIILVRKLWFI